MATLPNIVQDKVANEMYEAATRLKRGSRHYLGMSQIGDKCARKLWYGFRGYTPLPPEGRVLMLFRFGDRIEEEVVYFLRKAGYRVEGQQDGFKAHDGLFRGHCDGIIHGVTQRSHILEIKSANDSKFKAFKKAGVRKTYPVYYSQAQCYMGYADLDRALFVVQNKNNSEIYTERIHFVKSDFEALHQRAYAIITANDPPERQFAEESFNCQWCDHRVNCWYPEEAIVSNQVCGTCHYLGFSGLKKWCRHPDHVVEIRRWGIGCPQWSDRSKKEPVTQRVGFEEIPNG